MSIYLITECANTSWMKNRIILHSFEYVLDKRVVILYYRSKISYGLLYEFLQELI